MTTPPEKEKKSRFGGLLRKKDKDQRPNTLPDSAYASSETPSNVDASHSVVKNTSENTNIDQLNNSQKLDAIEKDDNLSVKPGTGDVVERDTGHIVTTVTTTTTTTTTTTVGGKNNGRQEQKVEEKVDTDTQQNPPKKREPPPSTAGVGANPDRDSAAMSELSGAPTPPADSASRVDGPVPTTYEDNPPIVHESPPIPPKSAMRKSMEGQRQPMNDPTSPVSPQMPPPGHSNFSYPRRQSGERYEQGQQSTLGNLKAAAAGIHGVGETLRGTFNSSIDNRFQSKDEQRNAAIRAKNDAVLARGKEEIDSGTLRRHQEREIEKEEQRQAAVSGDEGVKKRSGLGGLLRRKPVGENKSDSYVEPTGTAVNPSGRRHY